MWRVSCPVGLFVLSRLVSIAKRDDREDSEVSEVPEESVTVNLCVRWLLTLFHLAGLKCISFYPASQVSKVIFVPRCVEC
jgi:hypothetical protein